MTKTLLTLALAATLLAGCSKQSQQPAAAAAPTAAAPATKTAAAAAPTASFPLPLPPQQAAAVPAPQVVNAAPTAMPQNALMTGTVVETMDAAGYTYVKLKTANGSVWAAVPQTKVSSGATLTILGNMTVSGFESKTLNRKFDQIVFGNVVQPGKSAAAPAVSASGNPTPHPGTLLNAQKVDLANISVEKAAGPDAKTVAELFEAKSLKDAPVTVRGKVVKFLPEIMGKNWIHIRDGSGSAQAGDNDLTVTTNEAVKVGDIVTIKGTVRRNKDFGAGYAYAVIVEDASIVK